MGAKESKEYHDTTPGVHPWAESIGTFPNFKFDEPPVVPNTAPQQILMPRPEIKRNLNTNHPFDRKDSVWVSMQRKRRRRKSRRSKTRKQRRRKSYWN